MTLLGLCCCSGFLQLWWEGDMLWAMGFSFQWLLLLQRMWHMDSVATAAWLWSTGSRVVADRPSCSGACGIFPDQGSNLCFLRWSADSLPLSPQESPNYSSLISSNIQSLSSPPSLADTSHKSLEICKLFDCLFVLLSFIYGRNWIIWPGDHSTRWILLIVSFVCVLSHFSCVRLSETLWRVACQAPLFMGFSRQKYWSGLPCPPPGDLPDPGIKPTSRMSPALVLYH